MSGWIGNGRQVILVECYMAAPSEADLQAEAARATAACAALTAAGTTIAYLGALLVAADEAAFHLFGARDLDLVLEASRQAGLRVERVVPAVAVAVEPGHTSRTPAASATGEVD